MAVEYDFLRMVDSLSKINNKKLYRKKAKQLTERAFSHSNSFYPYRLALELDRNGYSVSQLEDHIINVASRSKFNLRYLVLFAQHLMGADIHKLQRAVIQTNNAELMAEFSNVPFADRALLENLILDLKVARASYLFISYHNSAKVEKHKRILLKSKKSKYIYKCATLAETREEFETAENLILDNNSNYYIRLMASLPFANLEKIENRIISTYNFEEIKKLYKITKSKRLAKFVLIM